MQHLRSRVSAGPEHASEVGNVVFRENDYNAEPKGGQNKIADIFAITTVCRTFGSDIIWRNFDKNIILRVFLLEIWGFSKTYGTGPVSTGFKHLEWVICSQVCWASSSDTENVLVRFPIQCHGILLSEITEIDLLGRMHFVLPQGCRKIFCQPGSFLKDFLGCDMALKILLDLLRGPGLGGMLPWKSLKI